MGEKMDKKTATDPRQPGQKVPQYQSDSEREDCVEVASEDSFPASDPPSYTPVRHAGTPKGERRKPEDKQR